MGYGALVLQQVSHCSESSFLHMEGVIHIHVMAPLCYMTFFDTPWEHAKLALDLMHLRKIWSSQLLSQDVT